VYNFYLFSTGSIYMSWNICLGKVSLDIEVSKADEVRRGHKIAEIYKNSF
jgi:hypothetical protein